MKNQGTKLFRVICGSKYCTLDYQFHELGVCIPNADEESAKVFTNKNAANLAIKRTIEAQDKVRTSMFTDWKVFKPLMFGERLEVEEFLA